MAPELFVKNVEYDGFAADVFALGVTLFVMYSRSFPFGKAVSDDSYFKCLIDKNFDLFWKSHIKYKPHLAESGDFMSLIERMLDPNPK